MSSVAVLSLGAIALFLASMWKNKDRMGHSRNVNNVVQPPPTIRDPIGGNSIFYGYFGRTNTAPNNI